MLKWIFDFERVYNFNFEFYISIKKSIHSNNQVDIFSRRILFDKLEITECGMFNLNLKTIHSVRNNNCIYVKQTTMAYQFLSGGFDDRFILHSLTAIRISRTKRYAIVSSILLQPNDFQ